jgi:hypothetical protein
LAAADPLAARLVAIHSLQQFSARFAASARGTCRAQTIGGLANTERHASRQEETMTMKAEVTNVAKKLIHDKIESQIKIAQARLDTLKAKAQATKATVELGAITELLTKKHAIEQKLNDLKKSTDTTYQQTKADVESRLAELEKSVQAIETKFSAA